MEHSEWYEDKDYERYFLMYAGYDNVGEAEHRWHRWREKAHG